jgi:excisionase family DNA binding protein
MTPIDPSSPWMTVRDAGTYVKRSPRFVRREIRAGRLKAARIGGRGEVLTRREWLDQWVEDQTQPIMLPIRRRA